MPRTRRLSRRAVLAACTTAALAGCLGDDSDGTPSTTGTPSTDAGSTTDEPTPGGTTPEGTTATETTGEFPAPGDGDWEAPSGSPTDASIEPEVLVENLEIPWDLAFTPDGELFITERVGRIVRLDADEVAEVARPEEAIDAGSVPPGHDEQPWWVEGGEGGTMGLAVHPEYPDEPYLYVYYTATVGDGKVNRVARYDPTAGNPGDTHETIVDGIPADTIHNGGRIDFGPEGHLWICTGDAGTEDDAQDPGSLAGSILRVTPEGEPAPGNPSIEGGDPRTFTYGHRNPQGISWLPGGVPIATEHGPAARGEVQLLRPGGNYGWPIARGGPDDDDYGSYVEHEEFVPPVLNTGPGDAWAPSGAVFYTGEAIPAWHNRFLIGCLGSQQLVAVTLTRPDAEAPPLDGDATRYDADWTHDAFVATAHRLLQDELGRIRRVAQSPDGEVYAITSNRDGRARGPFPTDRDDVLVRLTSA